MQNFRALGTPPPDPHRPPAAGCSTTPQESPQLRISGCAPAQYSSAVSHKKCVDLIEHQVKCLLEYYCIVSYGMLNENLNKIDF